MSQSSQSAAAGVVSVVQGWGTTYSQPVQFNVAGFLIFAKNSIEVIAPNANRNSSQDSHKRHRDAKACAERWRGRRMDAQLPPAPPSTILSGRSSKV
jgi:hypothetical protein